MSPRQTLSDRSAAASNRRTAPTSERPDVVTAPRQALVKLTVEIGPADHRGLKRWCDDAAVDLGRASVHGKAVFRALVAELLDGDSAGAAVLRRAVLDRIAAENPRGRQA